MFLCSVDRAQAVKLMFTCASSVGELHFVLPVIIIVSFVWADEVTVRPATLVYNCSSLVNTLILFTFIYRLSRTDSCLCEPVLFRVCIYVYRCSHGSVFSYIASCYYDGFIIVVFGTRLG